MAMSADGFITNKTDGFVDWTSKEDKKHFVAVTKDAGVLIYGSKTFALHNKPLPKRLNIVLTRTPDTSKNIPDQLEFTNQEPLAILEDLARRGFKKVALTGGAEINTLFLRAGLIDELFITVEPFIFGAGKRLFADAHETVKMELADTSMLNEQSVLLHYKVVK